MKVELTRDQWKTVYRSLPDGDDRSPLRGNVEAAGKATAGSRFATEGTYYDFAEAVHCLGDDHRGLANSIAYQLACELWAEVLALRGNDA